MRNYVHLVTPKVKIIAEFPVNTPAEAGISRPSIAYVGHISFEIHAGFLFYLVFLQVMKYQLYGTVFGFLYAGGVKRYILYINIGGFICLILSCRCHLLSGLY